MTRSIGSVSHPTMGIFVAVSLLSACTGPTGSIATLTPAPTECVVYDLSINHAPYTVRSLVAAGSSAFVGTVLAIEGGTWNTANGAQPDPNAARGPHFDLEVLTPVNVRVDRPLAGTIKAGTVRVLREGGETGCSKVVVAGAPALDVGRQHVVWTRQGVDFDGTARPDLQVVITAWPVDDHGMVATEEDGPVSVDRLAALIATAGGG